VSAKRSQLHAANLAHTPRYLFEQTLDVKATPQGLPYSKEVDAWKVNFKSNHLAQTYSKLESTTQALLMALDVTTDSRLITMRQDYQKIIDADGKSLSEQKRILHNLAIDMYHEIVRATKSSHEDSSRITGQFVQHFELLYGSGQRLVKIQPGVLANAPAPSDIKYKLNFKSHSKGLNHLNVSTCSLIRKLDAYEGELGALRTYHEKRCSSVSGPLHKIYVSDMALALWNAQPMDNSVRNFTKIKDQYLATVEWLYSECGQRLMRVEHVDPPAVPLVPLVDKLYAYLIADTKELYLIHSEIELELDKKYLSAHTRTSLDACFVPLVAHTCSSYALAKLSDWERINSTTQRGLRSLLVDKYIERVRR
jgi:hypothetical protein